MTGNLDRWRYYCSTIISPESYIEWGFYFTIAAALQRRVWRGQLDGRPLFPNLYTIFTADPGVGKGLVITEINKILRHFKLEKDKDQTGETKIVNFNDSPKQGMEKPLLFQVGADATSYEALVKEISHSVRAYFYKEAEKQKAYIHSSLTFCLEEISSLFRKHAEDLVRFLLVTYDCGDYRYDTISRGRDFIKNCCLSLIGGTTPKFLKRVFSDELLNEGFASRCIFIFELCNRFDRLKPPEFNEEQMVEYGIILQHIKKLSTLYGEVVFDKDAAEYLELWNRTEKYKRPNTSPKLNYYYSRKPATIQKLAMALHFMDSVEMCVNIEECQRAISLLDSIEKRMHFALSGDVKNPLSEVTDDIISFITKNGPQTKKSLLVVFWGSLPQGKDSLDQSLEYLLMIRKLKLEKGEFYIV